MLEEPSVLEKIELGELFEGIGRLDVIADPANGADQPDDFLLRRFRCPQQRHQTDDLFAKLERAARREYTAVGIEILADPREEKIDFVAPVALHRIGIQIKLDEILNDPFVLPFQLLEKAAHG